MFFFLSYYRKIVAEYEKTIAQMIGELGRQEIQTLGVAHETLMRNEIHHCNDNVFFFASLRGRAAQQTGLPEGFAGCDLREGGRPGGPERCGTLSI